MQIKRKRKIKIKVKIIKILIIKQKIVRFLKLINERLKIKLNFLTNKFFTSYWNFMENLVFNSK